MKNNVATAPKQGKNRGRWFRILPLSTVFGILLLLFGVGSLGYEYGPLLVAETRYTIKQSAPAPVQQLFFNEVTAQKALEPVDSEFGIMIPKIEANAPIVAEVDPYDSNIYQRELTKGVAHAKGTGFPGDDKTMFLFAHASGDIAMARRYNSIFYLLNKMEPNDEITIYYRGAPYQYQVSQVKTVNPDAIYYIENNPEADLILMTCTPPGTTWKRLLVFATLHR